MTHECDVLIVGGGPAGSSCAARLRQAGVDVLVIDRKAFPRDKTCAGWVTPQVLDVLQIEPADYSQNHVCQPITGFRTGLIGGDEIATRYDRVVSYGIRRCEFDHFLLERAAVPMLLDRPVDELRRTPDGWIVNGEIRARALVGAGGHFCPVARALGGKGRSPEPEELAASVQSITVAAQEVEFPLRPEDERYVGLQGEIPELYFSDDLAGYGWCFRKGNYLNIGLGRLNSAAVTSHVHSFCQFLRERGKVTFALPPRFHGHAYRIYERRAPKLFDDRVVLIGDSAGLAYPQSGEGIRPAVESGLMAAEVLLSAKGDYCRQNLEPYAERIFDRFGTPRTGSVADWLPASFLRFAAARLLTNQWFTRNVLLDRWFLHAETPAMAPVLAVAAACSP